MTHESTAAFGDDIALNRAVARTNLADPNDVPGTLVPEMTRGMPLEVATRGRGRCVQCGVGEAWLLPDVERRREIIQPMSHPMRRVPDPR